MEKFELAFKRRVKITVGVCTQSDVQGPTASWELKPLRNGNDSILTAGLSRAAKKMGTHYVHAPEAGKNGVVVKIASRFARTIDLGDDRTLNLGVVPADGTILSPGQTYAKSFRRGSPDPLIVGMAKSSERSVIVAAAYAGRKALANSADASVVRSMVQAFKAYGATAADMEMVMLFAPPIIAKGYHLGSPSNAQLKASIERRWPYCTVEHREKFYIDLEYLFKGQAVEFGVDAWTAYSATDIPHLTLHQKGPAGDNLVLIKHGAK